MWEREREAACLCDVRGGNTDRFSRVKTICLAQICVCRRVHANSGGCVRDAFERTHTNEVTEAGGALPTRPGHTNMIYDTDNGCL